MALAEHLQIRGLTEDNKLKQQQFQQQHQKLPQKQLPKIPAAIKVLMISCNDCTEFYLVWQA